MPIVEALSWALTELLAAYVFYNTGAVLIRLFTLGKKYYPLYGGQGVTRAELRHRGSRWCYLVGLIFYAIIATAAIIIIG